MRSPVMSINLYLIYAYYYNYIHALKGAIHAGVGVDAPYGSAVHGFFFIEKNIFFL